MNKEEIQYTEDNKPITLIPRGGIARRLRTIASMIHLAKTFERPLEILWLTEDSMPVSPDRLFTLVPSLRSLGIHMVQGTWLDRLCSTPPSPSNLFLTFPFTSIRYDRVLSVKHVEQLLESKRRHIETLMEQKDKSLLLATEESLGNYPNMYDAIEPTVEVNNVLLSSMASWSGRVIGVHLNRRINPQSTYRECPIELFIKRMQEMVEADPELHFFIATTSKDERERLATIFHDRVYVPNRVPTTHTLKGVIQSMGELLALSHTDEILTTPGSNYARVAAEIGHVPLETLSIYTTNN